MTDAHTLFLFFGEACKILSPTLLMTVIVQKFYNNVMSPYQPCLSELHTCHQSLWSNLQKTQNEDKKAVNTLMQVNSFFSTTLKN